MLEAIIFPVFDSPVGIQRGKTLVHGFQHPLFTTDIQIGFVLSGKTCFRKIFRSGTASDSYRNGLSFTQFSVSSKDGLFQMQW